MKKILRNFLPYTGDKPYIYFAFCESDAKNVRPLMDRLYRRGCRVWYPSGGASDLTAQAQMTERRLGASLVLVYMSDAAMRDEDGVKSSAGFCQSRGGKLIILDETGADGLSTGFTDGTVFLPVSRGMSAEELEARLIRTEGFSQELLGEAQSTGLPLRKKLAVLLAAIVISAFSLSYLLGLFTPKDSVTIDDPVILAAAHEAWPGALDKTALEQIRTLHLASAPESFAELALFPALQRLEVPVDCVEQAAALLDSAQYEIVLYGG